MAAAALAALNDTRRGQLFGTPAASPNTWRTISSPRPRPVPPFVGPLAANGSLTRYGRHWADSTIRRGLIAGRNDPFAGGCPPLPYEGGPAMSKPGKPAIRIVEGGNSESGSIHPSELVRHPAASPTAAWNIKLIGGRQTALVLSSSPIRVFALPRDGDNCNWGRLFEVVDPDGRSHRWSYAGRPPRQPRAVMTTGGTLLSLGARLALWHSGRPMPCIGISASTVDFEGCDLPRARAENRLGWHGGYIRAARRRDWYRKRSLSSIKSARPRSGLPSAAEARLRNGGCASQSRRRATRVSCSALAAAFAAPLLGPLQLEGQASIYISEERRQLARPRRSSLRAAYGVDQVN